MKLVFNILKKFEKEETVNVKFVYRNNDKWFMCMILHPKIVSTIPKCLENLRDVDLRTKRKPSSNEDLINTQKEKTSRNEQDEEVEPVESTPPSSSHESSEENSQEKTVKTKKSSTNKSRPEIPQEPFVAESSDKQLAVDNLFANFSLNDIDKEKLVEKTVQELYEQAEKGDFSKKLFIFKDGKRHYSERLHFFNSLRIFDQPSPSKTNKVYASFQCKICNRSLNANIGVITN